MIGEYINGNADRPRDRPLNSPEFCKPPSFMVEIMEAMREILSIEITGLKICVVLKSRAFCNVSRLFDHPVVYLNGK